MSKILLIVLFVALCSLHAWPQAVSHVRVKGRIIDKETQQPLADATVALLYAKDSSRAAVGFTDKNGGFVLDGISPGAYQLLITYIGYQQQLKAVNISADTLMQLENISLQRTGVTLGMVEIVEVRAPMVVKKDTLEFNADYYKARENAVMEELLKKLPGVEIAPDGTIKVNGETVKRILVDGRPFFGDDPKLAIRNLPADMIDKVQLIDRKSDQAMFSSTGNTEKEKVINITVKENRKGELIGQLAVGYGTDDRFAAGGNLNVFKDDEQISLLGSANNVNSQSFLNSGAEGIGAGGNGITRNWNIGVNYSKDVSKNLKISGSYIYNNNRLNNEQHSYRQNLLPDTTFYYNQDAESVNMNKGHVVNMKAEYKQDTMQLLIIEGNLGYTATGNEQLNNYVSRGEQQQLVNSGIIHNKVTGNILNGYGQMSYERRFAKPGRLLRTSLYIASAKNQQNAYNSANNLFIPPDGVPYADTLNQYNDIDNRQRNLSIYISYSEPVFKSSFLEAIYVYRGNSSRADKFTYDYNGQKKIYDRLDDSLTNSFKNTTIIQLAGLYLRTKREKYEYYVGLSAQLNNLSNYDLSDLRSLSRHTTNPSPFAYLSYTLNPNRYLNFSYTGAATPPVIAQLQPVADNTNPLYIKLGNPDLKPTYAHTIIANYKVVNPVTLRALSVGVNASIFSGKVINANWFDSLGRQVSQPQNVNGAYTISSNIMNTIPVKKLRTAVNILTSLAFNRDVSYVNGVKGSMQSIDIMQSINFNYTHKKVFDVAMGGSVNYNYAGYALQKDNSRYNFNYIINTGGNIYIPGGFTFGYYLNYLLNTGMAGNFNQSATLLNAYLSKSVFRQRSGLIKIQGFDLLKQNVSLVRNIGENYIEDVQSQVLKQFFMVSFIYFFKPVADR